MHLVICGFPRSGSTMFYNMLRHCVKDFVFFEKEIRAMRVLNKHQNQISKVPVDVFNIDEIRRAAKNPRFLITIRDPRSVLCSYHSKVKGNYKVSWNRILGNKIPQIHFVHYIDEVKKRINQGYPIVKYEDLIEQPYLEQDRLGLIFGFQYKAKFTDFYKGDIPQSLAHQMNGVRPLDASRLDAWKQHPERIKQQFTECPRLFDDLVDLGYEFDREWFDAL